jgi:hypothetical protein
VAFKAARIRKEALLFCKKEAKNFYPLERAPGQRHAPSAVAKPRCAEKSFLLPFSKKEDSFLCRKNPTNHPRRHSHRNWLFVIAPKHHASHQAKRNQHKQNCQRFIGNPATFPPFRGLAPHIFGSAIFAAAVIAACSPEAGPCGCTTLISSSTCFTSTHRS